MEKPNRLLLLSELRVRNTAYDVSLSRSVLTWKRRSSSPVYHPFRPRFCVPSFSRRTDSGVCHNVPVSEIVAVREEEEENRDDGSWKKIKEREGKDCRQAFTVLYVERCQRHRWRCAEVTFACPDEALCQLWISSIREQLTATTSRPKHLLVYINPYGGKRKGKHIYELKVAPLFAQAGIRTHVIVTEYANHARDHLKTQAELKTFDGVVCVGGDGMFSEIIHGLIWRTQADNGRNLNSPEETLLPCSLRIGIIPAGSTDCICFATVGTNDPVTSALHIIVGDSQSMDVCSVHHNSTFLRYSVSLLGYGFYGDVLTDSERKRWMGPARYDLSGVKMFLTHHYYEGSVSYLPARDIIGTPRDPGRCHSGCSVCQHNGEKHSESAERYKMDIASESESDMEWRTIRGKFLAINAASMSCACPRSPKGLSPAAHLADGTTDLILVRKCSRFDFLRHLLRHTSKDDQMASKTLIFFDLETTGLQTDVCNIIQVSAICEGRAFNGYAVPELPLSEHVRNLTGFAVDGPYLYRHGVVMQTLLVKDLLRCFIDYLSQFYCPLLVAHNAERFDAPVIMRVMAENGLLQRFRQVVSGFVDTYQLIKRLNPCLPGYSLTALVRQFLGQRFDAHNALEDAKILEKLFITWRPSKHHVDMCTSSI